MSPEHNWDSWLLIYVYILSEIPWISNSDLFLLHMCGLVLEHRRETSIEKHFIPYDIRVENQNSFMSQIHNLRFSVGPWSVSLYKSTCHWCASHANSGQILWVILPKMANSPKQIWNEKFQNSSRVSFLFVVFLKNLCLWFIFPYLPLWHSIIFSITICSHDS